ncbi:MAG: M15 family metallopeptidase [Clostridia bacterium]|nr:M15 family metallopeptidase [Clostridia bacterium]
MNSNPNRNKNPNTSSTAEPRDERKTRVLLAICVLVVMMLILLIVLMVSKIISPNNSHNDFHESKPESSINSTDVKYEDQLFNKSDIYAGELVLVDKDHKFVFPAQNTATVNIFNSKNTDVYILSDSKLYLNENAFSALNKMMIAFNSATGNKDACITTAYRSESDQQALYANNPSAYAKPGYSEYHTGNDVAIKINPSTSIDNDEDGKWITENCYRYGFIRRYPDSKVSITGENESKYITKQFRYVGYVHAYYMNKQNYCLEEYLEFLRENTSASDHLSIRTDNGTQYEIYYVPASGGDLTTVSVPSNCGYTVSGDNVGGFIVTVALG